VRNERVEDGQMARGGRTPPTRPQLLSGRPEHAEPFQRLALTREHAARALDMSLDSFERHVQPELRLIRRGRLRLVPVRELDRWLERNAERVLDEEEIA
jgi:hypothetical protein